MQNLKQPRRNKLIAIGVPLGLIVVALIVAIFLIHKLTASSDQPTELAGSPKSNGGLARKLADLETGLDKGLNVEQMQEFASGIQTEIQTHPLPNDDDLQFSGELVVKYLRELAAIESYRRTSISAKGYDPLDPKGAHPNTEMIEQQKKYSNLLRQRTIQFRERLSQSGRSAVGQK